MEEIHDYSNKRLFFCLHPYISVAVARVVLKFMRVAIIQSNYIPWKGYFDIINDVDVFVFLDDVQYTVRDWRNRNLIKTPSGLQWLTIPVGSGRERKIFEVEIREKGWAKQHWETIERFYSRARFFSECRAFFEEVYLNKEWVNLSTLNQFLIKEISTRFLGIKTAFYDSRDIPSEGARQQKLISILKYLKADTYISGPSAKDYIEPEEFHKTGIELIYKSYDGYPEYPQLFGQFEHGVSIIDLLFNAGVEAQYYIWGWRGRR
jgi:hypothetical protein